MRMNAQARQSKRCQEKLPSISYTLLLKWNGASSSRVNLRWRLPGVYFVAGSLSSKYCTYKVHERTSPALLHWRVLQLLQLLLLLLQLHWPRSRHHTHGITHMPTKDSLGTHCFSCSDENMAYSIGLVQKMGGAAGSTIFRIGSKSVPFQCSGPCGIPHGELVLCGTTPGCAHINLIMCAFHSKHM